MNLSRIHVIALVSLAGACASELPLEDRPCPCAPGNACRVADNVCISYEREAPGSSTPRCERDVAECAVPEQFIVQAFESDADLAQYLVGRWLWCGNDGPDPSAAGIEFADDGRFYLLHPNTSGACERSFGFDRAGTWSTDDISEQNTPGTYQVVMRWDGSGTGGMVPAFSGRPHKLRDRGPGSLGTLVADPQ